MKTCPCESKLTNENLQKKTKNAKNEVKDFLLFLLSAGANRVLYRFFAKKPSPNKCRLLLKCFFLVDRILYWCSLLVFARPLHHTNMNRVVRQTHTRQNVNFRHHAMN